MPHFHSPIQALPQIFVRDLWLEGLQYIPPKPTGIKTECASRRAVHRDTALPGMFALLRPRQVYGTFHAASGAIFTAHESEFVFEGVLSVHDEIECVVRGIHTRRN